MTRSLPLAGHGPAAGAHAAADASATGATPLAGRVEVFDPAMCCPSGLCGPGVDPALLAVSRDLRWLAKQGVQVARAGLASEPDAFVANARVAGLMQAFGDGALPATLVDGVVLAYGRYPTRAELLAALAAAPAPAEQPTPTAGDGCCARGGECC